MEIKTYPQYKDSGREIIGKIPNTWKTIKIENYSSLITDYVANGSFESLRKNVKYLDEESYAILIRLIDNTNGFSGPFVHINKESYDFLSKSKLKPGDIILSNIGATLGTIFKVPDLKKPMSLGPNVLLIRFDNTTKGDFFIYLMRSKIGKYYIDLITTQTTQPKFNKTDLRKLKIILPSLNEQKQISKYLDKKTSQIEENIKKNKKLIELLKEKRTSLINQTVTKGLNPDTPMKESGIEWIRKIPKHWKINKIKNLFEFTKGLNITKKDLTEKGIPVISYGQIHAKFNDGVHIKNELIRYTDKSNVKTNSKVSKGDFIFADTSEDIEGCGNSIYINKDMLLYGGYHDVILKSRIETDNTYLAYLFQSETWRKQLRSKVNGVKVYSINQSILKECYVLIPPNEEQIILVEYLDKTSKNIDKTIEKIKRNIELLEEFKESLIHHVVTGKIDVRGVEV